MKRKLHFHNRFRYLLVLLVPLLPVTACKKLVETPPPSESITGTNVYTTDATAITVLNGVYIGMSQSGPFQGNRSIALFAGLSADEFTLYNGVTNNTYLSYYKNALSAVLGGANIGSENWAPLYNYIFKCNAAIEGLESASSLTPLVKQQLLGEAKFLRAFFYFYLVNLFGDVPLVIETDPKKNTLLPRAPKTKVYDQIVTDLKDAIEKLSSDYLNETLMLPTLERVRPTRWAAIALLARVYLYTEDYVNAENMSKAVIDNPALFGPLPILNDAFLRNSREAIWQLQPTAINFNTVEAQTLIIPQQGPNIANNMVFLSDTLLKSFELGDKRAIYGNWVDTTIYKVTSTLNNTVAYSNKYKISLKDTTINSITGTKNIKEYFMVLRLAEQYLIRAEARAQQGKIDEAKTDLNAIRSRAGLTATTVGDKNALLIAILKERQVELFTEWGHRWFDLKRTGKIDEVMKGITPLKTNGAPWYSYQQLYPLPLISDLQKAPNLVQNDGYE